jgi:hypothetical protein
MNTPWPHSTSSWLIYDGSEKSGPVLNGAKLRRICAGGREHTSAVWGLVLARRTDRGRETASSPTLRTGQALFAHPALQSMGSTVRLRSSRFDDRLLALSTLSRAVVRLSSIGLVVRSSA